MRVYKLTLQSIVLGDISPDEWSRDALIEYLMDHPDMLIGVSSTVLTSEGTPTPRPDPKPEPEPDLEPVVGWAAVSPIQSSGLNPQEDSNAKPTNCPLLTDIFTPPDRSVWSHRRTSFSRDKSGKIRQPSEKSRNGSKVVHRANGQHEFYDTTIKVFYESTRRYRFRRGTGEIEFEYTSHDYLSKAAKYGILSSTKRERGKPSRPSVWLTRIESYNIKKLTQAVRLQRADLKAKNEESLAADTGGPTVVRFDLKGRVKGGE